MEYQTHPYSSEQILNPPALLRYSKQGFHGTLFTPNPQDHNVKVIECPSLAKDFQAAVPE